MNKIASFQVNHNTLEKGLYISRIDYDLTTFDLRFVKPNTPPFLEIEGVHTIEHLMATYLRNSSYKDNIIYFGPMGCHTGFYLITKNLEYKEVIEVLKDACLFIIDFNDEIPGSSREECGNYLCHDLNQAKMYIKDYYYIIKDWTEERMYYKQD